VPLGPFLAKNVGTTISPWVVTMEALMPFITEGPSQESPELLPYLKQSSPFSFDIQLEVGVQSKPCSHFIVTFFHWLDLELVSLLIC